jgi:hypothetical protein
VREFGKDVNRVMNERYENNTKCNQFIIAALFSHAKEIQSQNFGAVNKDYVIYAAEVRTTSACACHTEQ